MGNRPDDKNRGGRVKYWEIIADKFSKSGWSWGCVSAVDSNGRTIFVTDAHRGDDQRFIVRADEKLTGFVELESAAFRKQERDSKTRSRSFAPCLFALASAGLVKTKSAK
jgi:hypothetical protein